MKLDYFSLISPEPISFINIGSVKSPTLREVSKIGLSSYERYLYFLLMNITSYLEYVDAAGENYTQSFTQAEKTSFLGMRSAYESLDDEKKLGVSVFTLLAFDKNVIACIEEALNFFFVDDVTFDNDKKCFYLYDGSLNNEGERIRTGVIHINNYDGIIDIILQRVNVKKKIDETAPVKETGKKTVLKILEKFKKADKKKKERSKNDMDDLGNIISALSSHSHSLNIANIWDITIFQLYDQTTRQYVTDSYEIESGSISFAGDPKGKFKANRWLHNIQKD